MIACEKYKEAHNNKADPPSKAGVLKGCSLDTLTPKQGPCCDAKKDKKRLVQWHDEGTGGQLK